MEASRHRQRQQEGSPARARALCWQGGSSPAAVSPALNAQRLSWGHILRLTRRPNSPTPPGEPNPSLCTKEGLTAPPPDTLCYLHRGPPRARPGLVQLVRVLWPPGSGHIHVTAATVQLEAAPTRGHLGHELAEDADAAVPEGGLREPSHYAPCPSLWVIGLHHVREFKRIVVTT